MLQEVPKSWRTVLCRDECVKGDHVHAIAAKYHASFTDSEGKVHVLHPPLHLAKKEMDKLDVMKSNWDSVSERAEAQHAKLKDFNITEKSTAEKVDETEVFSDAGKLLEKLNEMDWPSIIVSVRNPKHVVLGNLQASSSTAEKKARSALGAVYVDIEKKIMETKGGKAELFEMLEAIRKDAYNTAEAKKIWVLRRFVNDGYVEDCNSKRLIRTE
jgi:hypothetical protein